MSDKITNIIIHGIAGRMGKINSQTISEYQDFNIIGATEKPNSEYINKDIGDFCGIEKKNVLVTTNLKDIINICDIVIDFTNPDSTMEALKINKEYKKGFIIGTTGLTEEQNIQLKKYSNNFPIVYAPNFSIGVNVLFKITEIVAKLLDVNKGYDLEIIEAHHRHKKDSPSGTAMKLLDIASKNSNRNKNDTIYGRKGFIGERDIKEIGMNVIRAGDIVGEHTVMYSNEGERLEITHKAHNRKTFSMGVIQAIYFIKDKKTGLYSMTDVLGL